MLVQGVEGDQDGLGYFGFSYYEQNADALNLVSVDEGSGCVAPSSETIQDGSYSPLSRPLFMYPSAEAIAKPEVAGFMQYVVDNYSEIAEAALIVPMDDSAGRRRRRRRSRERPAASPTAGGRPHRHITVEAGTQVARSDAGGSGPSASLAAVGARRRSGRCSSSPR